MLELGDHSIAEVESFVQIGPEQDEGRIMHLGMRADKEHAFSHASLADI